MIKRLRDAIKPLLCEHIVVSGFCPWHHANAEMKTHDRESRQE
ncbi:MAG: hypothetical protein ACLU7S_01980 [Hominisplanchenecus sp.]